MVIGVDARLLPDQFVTAYEALHVLALNDGTGSENHPLSGRADEVGVATGKDHGGKGPRRGSMDTYLKNKTGPARSKKVGKTSRFLGNERAWHGKRRIDKRLRKMAKEILLMVDDLQNGGTGRVKEADLFRVCSGRCKKFCEDSWKFCPNCGGPTREMDKGND